MSPAALVERLDGTARDLRALRDGADATLPVFTLAATFPEGQ